MQEVNSNSEESLREAVEQNPNDSSTLISYALHLRNVKKDYDEAEKILQKVIEIVPEDGVALIHCAQFHRDIRKDFNKANELYQRYFITFLFTITELWIQVLPLQQSWTTTLSFWKCFWKNTIKLKSSFKGKEKVPYQIFRAVEADPEYTTALNNYAQFLKDQRKDFDKAELYYKRYFVI